MSKDRLIIVGAGMAGLLAANMLRHRNPVIYESQPELPNNHSAVLRFRTPLVGEVLGIPFKRVKVIKATLPWRNPVADAISYSVKNTGKYRSDRSLPTTPEIVERWIAPPDLVERMASGVQIVLGHLFNFSLHKEKVISTIPMSSLMRSLEYSNIPDFETNDAMNIKAKIRDCDAYVSLYVPGNNQLFSRISITGDELIAECIGANGVDLPSDELMELAALAADLVGVNRRSFHRVSYSRQRYAKIAPIDEHQRKSFIFWASSVTGRAFSLGRFATWRPGLLMDDLVKDVRLINSWIESGTPGYEMDIHHGRSK